MGRGQQFQLSEDPNCDVTVINRRKSHWGDEIQKQSNIKFYYGDRDYSVEFYKLQLYINQQKGISENSGQKWDLIIDFCAFNRKEVKSIIKGLSKLALLYILISTDSVYDVSDLEKRVLDHDSRILEESAIRPLTNEAIDKLEKSEYYGHDKLRCEEYLASHQKTLQNPFAYICLRQPDVIGPFDGTSRFWAYIKWIKHNKHFPIHIDDESLTNKLSFVFSQDVISLIHDIAKKLQSSEQDFVTNFLKRVNGGAYNLCFNETITLKEFIEIIARKMGEQVEINFQHEDNLDRHAKTYYPSVECGAISCKQAKVVFGFEPTSLDQALGKIVSWFSEADSNSAFLKERKSVNGKFEKVKQMYNPNKVQIVSNNLDQGNSQENPI